MNGIKIHSESSVGQNRMPQATWIQDFHSQRFIGIKLVMKCCRLEGNYRIHEVLQKKRTADINRRFSTMVGVELWGFRNASGINDFRPSSRGLSCS